MRGSSVVRPGGLSTRPDRRRTPRPANPACFARSNETLPRLHQHPGQRCPAGYGVQGIDGLGAPAAPTDSSVGNGRRSYRRHGANSPNWSGDRCTRLMLGSLDIPASRRQRRRQHSGAGTDDDRIRQGRPQPSDPQQRDVHRYGQPDSGPGAAGADRDSPDRDPVDRNFAAQAGGSPRARKDGHADRYGHADGNHDCYGHAYPRTPTSTPTVTPTPTATYTPTATPTSTLPPRPKATPGAATAAATAAADPTGPASLVLLFGGIGALSSRACWASR